MVFDCTRAEFPRIFVHELFHFVWLRAGNPNRFAWEALMRRELDAGAGGELGWSAEWRKQAMAARDHRSRSRRWRDYCCESFCDTAAWLYSGAARHPEFTLAARFRAHPPRLVFTKPLQPGVCRYNWIRNPICVRTALFSSPPWRSPPS
jgi:hypothetical protein